MTIDQGALVVVTLALASAIWKLSNTSAKVDILYSFWETKMERRSEADERNTLEKPKG